MLNEYQILKNYTKNTALLWKQSRGIATDDVADKMDAAMLDWMVELTDCLGIWIEKGLQMTDGELILADTNIGALVESWLKFFYCVHYRDYVRERQNGAGRQPMREPEKLQFVELQQFSEGRLWDAGSSWNQWVDKIRNRRNGVHSFLFRDIGTAQDFITDVDELLNFVRLIHDRLPPIEDSITEFPEGYVPYPENLVGNLF